MSGNYSVVGVIISNNVIENAGGTLNPYRAAIVLASTDVTEDNIGLKSFIVKDNIVRNSLGYHIITNRLLSSFISTNKFINAAYTVSSMNSD